MTSTKLIAAVGVTAALLAATATQTAAAADPSAACTAMATPVRGVVSATGSSLVTTSDTEAQAAAKGGTDRGTAFLAATGAGTGLVGVHRLHNAKTGDYVFTTSDREVGSAVASRGYTDEGVRFYTAKVGVSCTTGVTRLVKGSQHRLATTAAEVGGLTAAGWRSEGVKLHVVAAPATGSGGSAVTPTNPGGQGSRFEFAVVPDTQLEVLKANDVRLASRNAWLVKEGVSFVAQTGDLVNWDTAAHEQYQRAKAGMDVLHDNHTPYTVAVGNHDTQATTVGGSARPGKTWQLVRDTSTLNHYFSAADFGNVGGAFEPGKIDNVYATYTAGGKKFLVLTLEFCPRKEAVEWARSVVATHPDYNVIISTHYYLTSGAKIGQDNNGYGASTPQYVFDRLVSQYPNIKMVFSGHVGTAAKARVDTGVHGNKVYSFLTTFHEGSTNPVRVLKVDTAKGTITSTIYAPYDDRTWTGYDQTITGVDFI